ncbi:redox-sensitive transcriptional activator SoxR [Aliiroseovarius sp. KMU-50]|uniref:Redox-sensitive transcriptional activator SoxR n=1 Tax=Aliiroseovarius salicola TaxID=3009082 RepID=A0ABT4VXB9_9RHOB|nr:redox-sensitive transcriptional activator SoxR [Aliiroseovarius sp. KMU-50]MDA5092892.1 redox-sensitive transcriptional activator SoxR [Aliiroseovarius sp. KMU-50]
MERRNEISIGTLANRTGLAVSAIRYYETQGLVAPERNAGGQRRFLRSDIRRLSFVMIAQKFGFTLDRIREVLGRLPEKRTPNANDWSEISKDFRAELDEQIAALTRLRDKLDGCIGCGCLSLDRCALYNPDDVAAEKGSGPRYLLGDEAVRPED